MVKDDYDLPMFTPEQVNALFRACRMTNEGDLMARDHALVAVALDTGMREKELSALSLDALAQLPLGRHARMAVDRYVTGYRPASASQQVFLSQKGQPLTAGSVEWLLGQLGRRVADEIGDTPVTARTCATTHVAEFLAAGGDPKELGKVVPRASLTMLHRYRLMSRKIVPRPGEEEYTSVLDRIMYRSRFKR